MNRTLLAIIGLALLAFLMYHCLTTRPEVIQADVLACSKSQMATDSFDGVVVDIDGRDVTLSGQVASDELNDQAQALILDNCGARVVNSALLTAPLDYATSMCIDHSGITVSGAVPDAATRDRLMGVVHDRMGESRVSGSFELQPNAVDGFERVASVAIAELAQFDHGCFEFNNRQLLAKGEVRSAEAVDRLVTDVDRAAQDDVDVTYELTVPQLSAEAVACQTAYDELTSPGDRVFFDFDSTEIHQEGRALLDHIEELSEQCPSVNVIIAGHTDSTGETDYNRDLSQRRADAVMNYLVSTGFGAERLTAVGYGESQPRESNSTDEGRAANRRIEFRVRESR